MRRVTLLLISGLAVVACLGVPAIGGTDEPAHRTATYQPDRLVVTYLDRRVEVVALPPGSDVPREAVRYQRRPDVLVAEPNWAYRVMGAPDDPGFAQEWGLHNSGQKTAGRPGAADVDIDAPEGWAVAYGEGRYPRTGGTVVGVIDTGVDTGHPDLAPKVVACASALSGTGQVVNGGCGDDHGHGTHVAGTLAAATSNSTGVAGVAPDAQLAVFKALDRTGFGYDADIVAGVRWLRTVAGARVINMSFGDVSRTSVLEDELAAAAAAGVLLVSAVGNEGDATANYPAHHPDVISVAAVDSRGALADYSNCNGDVEVSAPGTSVASTAMGGGYGFRSGTSMAAPHVAGVAAVLMSARGISADQARATLTRSFERDGRCNGVGLVNLHEAMTAPVAVPPPSQAPSSPSRTPSPSPSSWLPLPLPILGSQSPSPSPTRRR